MLSNLDENPPVNSNFEPSINATSDLSNDSGSSNRATDDDTLVIRIPEWVKTLSSKNKNGMNCELIHIDVITFEPETVNIIFIK